ncbi:hypothetical protein C8Z91_06925 [Paenibacillus elgii]|uniref:Uncharacterized protein n=1 Tax=Paenibacillus elgii TaxID=189691 RepID=A0A2T6G6L6_9BACL|nr:hypothetical protein [Paenibacillus elgii]PUA39799.1 hypothetical protein C8Z91_06925 [Paenibacillus elgii]
MRNHFLADTLSALLSPFRKKSSIPQIPCAVDLEEVQTFHFFKLVSVSFNENDFTEKSRDAGSFWIDTNGRYRAEYTEGSEQGNIWVWDGHYLKRYYGNSNKLFVEHYDPAPTPYALFDQESFEWTVRNIQNNTLAPTHEPRTYESITESSYVKVRLNESQTLIESMRQYSKETLISEYDVIEEEYVLRPNSEVFQIKLSRKPKIVYG